MHGRMIVFISHDDENSVKNCYDEIIHKIGADYIGERLYGDEAMATFERFKNAMATIDVNTLTVKDAVEFNLDYPVVILDGGGFEAFRSFVEFKAYCEYWKDRYKYDYGYLYGFEWQVWDFHF